MLRFPLQIIQDGNGHLVTCPDLPEVTTDGDTIAEAITNGADAIEEALAGRLDDFEPIPRPTAANYTAAISSLIGLKVLLFWELEAAGINRAELARRLGWSRTQVDRLFLPRHATRLDQFDSAFAAFGKHLTATAA